MPAASASSRICGASSQSRPIGDVMREAERLVGAGVKELLVISQDTSAYGLDIGYAKSAWRGEERETRFIVSRRGARQPRRLGAAALRLSLSACRSGPAADGGGQGAALSRHSLPAREPHGAEGHAPPGAAGEDARAHPRLARRSARPRHPLDLHRRLPRRDRGGFRLPARLALAKRGSPASAASNTRMWTAPPPMLSPASCRRR